jgi:hypothetical protein
VDSVKSGRARTVPLVEDIVPLVDRWAAGKQAEASLFAAPGGGPLRESNWKRPVKWSEATAAIGALDCGCTIYVTPRHRCGSARGRTRRWSNGCWDMPQHR